MFRELSYGLLLLCVSNSITAHSLYPDIELKELPLSALTNSKLPDVLISDNEFTYQPYFRPFDLDHFLAETLPTWHALSEPFQHWAGATGVDPRVLLTTLIILFPEKTPSAEEIKTLANQLSQGFYHYESHRSLSHQRYNPATLAIAQQLPTTSAWQTWLTQYEAWFYLPAPELEIQTARSDFIAPDSMQWPWRQGYSWVPNGPHSHSGSGYPLSSIDVSYDWPQWGAPTYSVTAAHDGYVTVLSRCQVRVSNPNGWETNYYHMDGIQVGNKQWVTRDTKLGVYASQRSTALCEGGSSTGPHLHFSLLYKGRFQSIQGVQFGPYQVQSGRYNYDNDCRYAWLNDTRNQRKMCFFQRVDNPAR